ncbi:uncharacterized protein VTP21DRAFT_2515 [Calcarisporiella thermophila]|uniref:uncharacterized protein n=1 Tax=Calcarisporiella thermophila TaxID=911321 RepID=UPI00374437D2
MVQYSSTTRVTADAASIASRQAEPKYTKPTHTRRFYIYWLTSLLLTLAILALASYRSGSVVRVLLNQVPKHPQLMFGRFLIRGKHPTQSFAYAWRLKSNDRMLARISAWMGYIVHQLGQWGVLYLVHRKGVAWGNHYGPLNWLMVGVNGFGVAYKFIQCHWLYGGLAEDFPEAMAQASVVMWIPIVMLMEMPRRGLVLGNIKRFASSSEIVAFFRKYHGYVISFGVTFTFHYHPLEGTLGHLSGFFYMFLMLFGQTTNFGVHDHRNRSWTLALETLVWLHAVLTALLQTGPPTTIFFGGFFTLFCLCQFHGAPFLSGQRHRLPILLGAWLTVLGAWLTATNAWRRAFMAVFIPLSEYFYVLCYAVAFFAGRRVYARLPRGWVAVVLSALVSALMLVLIVYSLGGNLSVVNDEY